MILNGEWFLCKSCFHSYRDMDMHNYIVCDDCAREYGVENGKLRFTCEDGEGFVCDICGGIVQYDEKGDKWRCLECDLWRRPTVEEYDQFKLCEDEDE